jgi:type II secretory pathway component PulK
MTRSGRRRQRGIALLLVLWAFTTLGVLALDFGRYMRDDAKASVNFAEETQAYYIALAAMNKAIYEDELARGNRTPGGHTGGNTGAQGTTGKTTGKTTGNTAADGDEDQVTGPGISIADGQWYDEDFAGGQAQVRVTDECGRIPLNYVNETVLTPVITNLLRGPNATQGMNNRQAKEVEEIVDAILDWRDADHIKRLNGAEREYYRSARGYDPKDGFFDSPQELLLVKGVTADLFYGVDGRPGLRDVVSVFCKLDKININTITSPVLQALGVEAADADEMVQERTDDPTSFESLVEQKLTAIDPALANVLESGEPQMVLVEARADMSKPDNRSTISAVMNLEDSGVGEKPITRLWMDRAPWQGIVPRATVGGEPVS